MTRDDRQVVSDRPEAAGEARITLEFPASSEFRAVARLVLGGLASRCALPVDQLEELLLALEILLLDALADEVIGLQAWPAYEELHVRAGPFARSRLSDPPAARVVAALVDAASEETDPEDRLWVQLAIRARPPSDA